MNARGNISARSRKRHVANVDAPTRGAGHADADPAYALVSVVIRLFGGPVQTSENPRIMGYAFSLSKCCLNTADASKARAPAWIATFC
jgi:hypothetical protein